MIINQEHKSYLYDNVCKFNIKSYCMEKLSYIKCIKCFHSSIDALLISIFLFYIKDIYANQIHFQI